MKGQLVPLGASQCYLSTAARLDSVAVRPVKIVRHVRTARSEMAAAMLEGATAAGMTARLAAVGTAKFGVAAAAAVVAWFVYAV